MLTVLLWVAVVVAFFLFAFAGHWLFCRLTSLQCPACGSKWQTTLVGEWGDEHWACRACGHGWFVPYAGAKKGGA